MEKPILFNTAMVQAILKGDKTSTRRPIKIDLSNLETDSNDKTFAKLEDQYGDSHDLIEYAPYHAGDTLYVRETFRYDNFNGCRTASYKANFTAKETKELFTDLGLKWKPSIHMPKTAARLFLKVTDVRVERLQDITEVGATEEGFDDVIPVFTAKQLFQAEWNSIYKNRNENPWVWAIEFEKM